jgi:hypothetical protein
VSVDPPPTKAVAVVSTSKGRATPPKSGNVVQHPTANRAVVEQSAIAMWNGLAERMRLPMCKALNDERRRKLHKRLEEAGGLEGWSVALDEVERSRFLCGSNNRGWRAGIDFMLQASSFAKVIEGTYAGMGDPIAGQGKLHYLTEMYAENVEPKRDYGT